MHADETDSDPEIDSVEDAHEPDLETEPDAAADQDPDAAIDLASLDVQCNAGEASIRRALEERREERRLKQELDELDFDL